MASINFRLKGKNDISIVYIRFKQGNQFDLETSTKLKVKTNDWSKAKQKLKINNSDYTKEINQKLSKLKTFVEEEYFKTLGEGETPDKFWIKNVINKFFKKDIIQTDQQINLDNSFTGFIENFIEEAKNRINRKTGKRISDKTIRWYKITKKKIEAYEKSINSKFSIHEIDLKFHKGFISFLEDKQKLNENTIGGHIRRIRLFCGEAERKGLKINIEYKHKDFYIPFKTTENIYLNENEIEQIFKLDLSFSEKYDNARDWLIIGLWTGLRISDLFSLSMNDIEDGLIFNSNKKTEIPVIIPIHPQVDKILKKGNGFPKPISEPKLNQRIKKVCKIAKINKLVKGAKMVKQSQEGKKIYRKKSGIFPKYELVSTHICRRSFATNHYGKLDTLTLMKITGHKTERQFLDYIKITPKEYALKLKEYWKEKSIN
ncbi:site-specific integrase [Mesonia maritima]|uniref:Integrase n=1 Tax=Mesonia maritima TaxID=1793873 RepID=A0ABU1K4X7_9FLAO|nr:site-specific integrase [Mesonia maritima]MDR6300668.1 integrase [Mesonia maritima]